MYAVRERLTRDQVLTIPNAIIGLCAATMVFSFVLYLVNYARMLRKSVK